MQKKTVLWIALALVTLVVLSGVGYYRFVVWPHLKFREVCEDPAATDQELREAIHRLITWNKSHDGFIMLEQVGDESSIPLLIQALGRIPEAEASSGVVECTWDHCRETLVALTGEDFGYDADSWRAWWVARQADR